MVDPTLIRSYLEELSAEPHMAGLERDELLAAYVADEWRKAGLDKVHCFSSDHLFSLNKHNPQMAVLGSMQETMAKWPHSRICHRAGGDG